MGQPTSDGPIDIALVGDLTDNEAELTDKLLSVPPGGHCTLWINSPGGSPYCAMSLMSLMLLRGIQATGIVTGECSSAALWPFAACRRRLVTPYSVLLFHPMKWQSEEHVRLAEAAEWAAPLWTAGNRHGPTLGADVRRVGSRDGQVDQPRPLRRRARVGGHRVGRNGRAQDARAVRHERCRTHAQAHRGGAGR